MTSPSEIAKTVWRKVSDVADRYERRRYPISYATNPTPQPTVYFLTPDYRTPAGGIRVIYRHVDFLNEAGIRARVLHRHPGFRCTWFENETEVADIGSVTISQGDLLVVSELEADVLSDIPPAIDYVIFNQNSHLTWARSPYHMGRYYAGAQLSAVVCVSEHNRDMLAKAFAQAPIRRIHLGIDDRIFHPGQNRRPLRIAYMPRRGADDARLVIAFLRQVGLPEGWEIKAIDGLSHEAVADELRKARIFLAFTRQEGFGLPPAEAMACGCYVIGNDGFAGREFFDPRFSARVENGDVVGFFDAITHALNQDASDPTWCETKGRAASRYVLSQYPAERERAEVTALYASLIGAARAKIIVGA